MESNQRASGYEPGTAQEMRQQEHEKSPSTGLGRSAWGIGRRPWAKGEGDKAIKPLKPVLSHTIAAVSHRSPNRPIVSLIILQAAKQREQKNGGAVVGGWDRFIRSQFAVVGPKENSGRGRHGGESLKSPSPIKRNAHFIGVYLNNDLRGANRARMGFFGRG